jgi:hypothetical protein
MAKKYVRTWLNTALVRANPQISAGLKRYLKNLQYRVQDNKKPLVHEWDEGTRAKSRGATLVRWLVWNQRAQQVRFSTLKRAERCEVTPRDSETEVDTPRPDNGGVSGGSYSNCKLHISNCK